MKAREINYALCTLFDSNYLDKGLVLYDTIEHFSSPFTLYVLAMNDKCYEVLSDLKLSSLIPIKLSDFENDDLLRVKQTRSIAEYCWTCSSSLVKYVLEKYAPDYCTYIDADMAFYDDPYLLIKELEEKTASVSIVGHRFSWYNDKSGVVGKYCVECNTFKNDENSENLLKIWISQCLEHCSIDGDGIYWGDQKYLDNWVEDYDFVIETELMGAGVAPWNIAQYKLDSRTESEATFLTYKDNVYRLLFYHFENISFIENNVANIAVYKAWGISDKLVNHLYNDYLNRIVNKRLFLSEKYNLLIRIKNHPGLSNNQSVSFLSRVKKIICSGDSFWYITLPSLIFRSKNLRLISLSSK